MRRIEDDRHYEAQRQHDKYRDELVWDLVVLGIDRLPALLILTLRHDVSEYASKDDV